MLNLLRLVAKLADYAQVDNMMDLFSLYVNALKHNPEWDMHDRSSHEHKSHQLEKSKSHQVVIIQKIQSGKNVFCGTVKTPYCSCKVFYLLCILKDHYVLYK